MSLRRFSAELWLPRAPAEVFPFFSEAKNLQRITPPWLDFSILTPPPIEMRAGALIDYRLKVHGLPLRWRTEITAWEPPTRFVDEQVRGPYRVWRHTHTFEAKDGGTLCRDEVEYAAIGGVLIEKLFVRRDIERIFRHRNAALAEIFH